MIYLSLFLVQTRVGQVVIHNILLHKFLTIIHKCHETLERSKASIEAVRELATHPCAQGLCTCEGWVLRHNTLPTPSQHRSPAQPGGTNNRLSNICTVSVAVNIHLQPKYILLANAFTIQMQGNP